MGVRCAAFLAILGCVAASAGDPPPKGLRVICRNLIEPRHEEVYKGILAQPYVSGLLVYVDWRYLEPREGEFQWRLLDRPLELAREHGKVVSIGIPVQVFSPPWLLQGSNTYSFRHIHPSVGVVQSPVPWDPDYKEAMKRMVTALAERYDGKTGVHYIAMTGPSSLFGLETNFPMAELSPDMSAGLGYTNAKFEAGWRDMIDHYMNCFSQSDLSLGMHHDIPAFLGGSHDDVMQTVRSIRDYAIQRQADRANGRLVLRLLGLGLDNPKYFPGPYTDADSTISDYLALVWEVRDKVDVAFEVNRVFSRPNAGRPPLEPDQFARVLQNGITYGPRWIEVKEWDVWDTQTNAPYAPYVPPMTDAAALLQQE